MSLQIHPSVFLKTNPPQVTRCTECCALFHCPLCPTGRYKPRSKAMVLQHLEVHKNNALQHEDFYITKCHQACRPGNSGHFHCPFCFETKVKRQDAQRHLKTCRPLSVPVNATGSGERRTVDQIKLRSKNFKQKATKDLSESKNTSTENKQNKDGEFTNAVLDIVGGESSQALHSIVSADTGKSMESHVLDRSTAETIITLESEGESSTSQSCGEVPPVPPRRPRRKRHYDEDHAYQKLLKMETERAQQQIVLAKEQITLTMLQQEYMKLKIQLLKKENAELTVE